MQDNFKPESQDLAELQEEMIVMAKVNIDPRLRGKLDLSDVVNHTLAEASQDWDKLQDFERTRRRNWLYKAFMNNLRDALRKLRSRQAQMERSLDQAMANSSLRVDAWLPADNSTPSQKVIRQEEAEQLTRALGTLPEREREAIILQRWQGWKLHEIAAHLECTTGAVAGLIHRGQAKLRQELEKLGFGQKPS